jgi:hypothetical protein
MPSNDLQKLSLVGLGLLLGAIVMVIVTPPANGYEVSIYGAYPVFFWALLLGSMLVATIVIVGSAHRSHDRTWVFGVLLFLFVDAIVLLLPYLRGYLLYGVSDAMTHIGYTMDIDIYGAAVGNIYPPMHLVALLISDATGLDVMTVGLFLPVVFSAVYFGGMYYVLTYMLDSRTQVLFGLPFVLLPVLGRAHINFRPYDAAVLLIPVLLYVFFKSQRTPTLATRTVLVVVLVAVLLYHPLTALFLVVVFLFYLASRYIPQVHDRHDTPTSFVSLSAAVFLAWYTTFISILKRFDLLYEKLFGASEGQAPVEGYTSAAEKASPPLIDIVQTAVFQYGVEFVLFGLGYLFLVLALLLLFQKQFVPTSYVMMLGGTLLVFSFGGLAFLFVDLLAPHSRPWKIAKIAAVIVVGQLFYMLVYRWDITANRSTLRAGAYSLLVVCIALLIGLSVMGLYPSPYNKSSNAQVTEMEVAGSEWAADHGSTDHQVAGVVLSYHRFHDALYGKITPQPFEYAGVPNHFNYTEHRYLGDSYETDIYLVVNERGRIVYPEVFPDYRENWRYTPEDFARLERDRTAQRIYDSGEYNQYRVEARPSDTAN